MGFFISGQTPRRITFNNNYVNEVWYKEGSNQAVLVWENPLKIETETWEGLKTLCDEVKDGMPWPEDIKVGSIRKLNLHISILGTNSVYVRLIGIDVEGPGTLTFQVMSNGKNGIGGFNQAVVMNKHVVASEPSSCAWIGSDYRELCQQFYNSCEAKPYIKKVQKYTCATSYSYSNPEPIVPELNEETVWALSSYEVGDDRGPAKNGDIKECSLIAEGVYSQPYEYCKTAEYNQTKIYSEESSTDYYETGSVFWLRGLNGGYVEDDTDPDEELETGVYYDRGYEGARWIVGGQSKFYFEPCFVIG